MPPNLLLFEASGFARDTERMFYPRAMSAEEAGGQTPVLDAWPEEVGDEAVASAVQAARDDIAAGRLPGFSDKGQFLEYLRGTHRRPA